MASADENPPLCGDPQLRQLMSARSLSCPRRGPVIPASDQGCDHSCGDAASAAAAPRVFTQRGSLIQTSRFLRRCSFGADPLFIMLSALIPLQQSTYGLSRCQKKRREKGGGKKKKQGHQQNRSLPRRWSSFQTPSSPVSPCCYGRFSMPD